MEHNEHLDYLLLPPGKVSQIGPEKGQAVRNGIARFVSAEGSNRYVYYKDGEAVAAIQVMDLSKVGGTGGHLTNVFVKKSERRSGLASQLFKAAKKDFPALSWSADLSDAGKAFKEKVTSRYVLAEDSTRFTLAAKDILTSKKAALNTLKDIQNNKKSHTPGPLEVWRLEDGRYLLVDGQHRFIEGLLKGKTSFDVELVGEGYTDYWATPAPSEEFNYKEIPKKA